MLFLEIQLKLFVYLKYFVLNLKNQIVNYEKCI